MTNYRNLPQLVEDIRIKKGMRIEDLCDDVISIRTYYRFLISGNDVSILVFIKLLDKLDINIFQLKYTIDELNQVNTDDFVDFNNLLLNATYRPSIDISSSLVAAKDKYNIDSNKYKILEILTLKNSYDKNNLDKETYLNKLIAFLPSSINKKVITSTYLYICSLIYNVDPSDEIFYLNKVINKKISFSQFFDPLLNLLSYDNFLKTIIFEENSNNESNYVYVYRKYLNVLPLFNNKRIYVNSLLFEAYMSFINNKKQKAKSSLSNYLISLLMFKDEKTNAEKMKKLEEKIPFVKDELVKEKIELLL